MTTTLSSNFQHIYRDFREGFVASIRVDLLYKQTKDNRAFRNLVWKLIKYNLLFHIVPWLTANLLEEVVGPSIWSVWEVVDLILNVVSYLFHMLHWIDLIFITSTSSATIYKNIDYLDSVSMAFTMMCYQFSVMLGVYLMNFLLFMYPTLPIMYATNFLFARYPMIVISTVSQFLLGSCEIMQYLVYIFALSLYHSFYCYNNLWQHHKLDIGQRINFHEKMWGYFSGFGLISTLIYVLPITSPIATVVYHMYMIIVISMPFIVKIPNPNKPQTYPHLPLGIFSVFIRYLFLIVKCCRKRA